ncbi:MAG: hypothetical protein HY942_06910 [Gammaproteobacteria bacterium]|nr:hypothetical protein [Gammaproteobacteria bacterium]
MKKFIMGFALGMVIAFPLGINFGKDVPLWSNPFAAKPDIPERIKERAGALIKDTKEALHEATEPVRKEAEKKLAP